MRTERREHVAISGIRGHALADLGLLAVAGAAVAVLFGWADDWLVDSLLVDHPAARWAVAGGAVLAVLVRRPLPATAVLVAAGLAAADPLTGAAWAIVAYSAGLRPMSVPRRVALLGASVALPAAVTAAATLGERAAIVQYRINALVVTAVVCGVLPALVGIVVGQRERLLAALRDRNASLRRAHRATEERSRLLERSRIAREMHDLLGHRLSLIALHAGGLELASRSAGGELLSTSVLVHSTARQAMHELRGVLGVLGADDPAARSDPWTEATGTRADVADLVAGSRTAGIAVGLDWTGEDLDHADPAVRRAVHRVVREALTNVHKHAASAPVAVAVRRTGRDVRIEVRNGRGGHPTDDMPGNALGLVGLRERVRLLGGTLHAAPTVDGGFTVAATIPLTAHAEPGGPDPLEEPATETPAQGTWTRAVTAVTMALGVVGVVALQYLALAFVPYPGDDTRAEMVEYGTSYADFVDRFGLSSPRAEATARGHEPDRPAGARCDYHFSTDRSTATTAVVHRYCFVDDELVEIEELAVARPAE
ncbi:histidine kinase [Longispora sp. K20-0274]|uniref:sensor histidine kinase n=1 Tax=Longispora sp. K20-0274 TaxID=3088255 RepID=UPI00399A48FB